MSSDYMTLEQLKCKPNGFKFNGNQESNENVVIKPREDFSAFVSTNPKINPLEKMREKRREKAEAGEILSDHYSKLLRAKLKRI